MNFRPNQRVKLLPFEDQPEEHGEILSRSGSGSKAMYIVAIDDEYIDEDTDDGIRECDASQLEAI